MDTEGLINNLEDAWKVNFEDLVFEKEIGRGAFGAVFKGSYFGTDVAIKKVFELEDDPDAMIYLEREVNVLKGMRHPNIVQFIGICNDKEAGLHIVTEFVKSGDLRRFLKRDDVAMGWRLRIKIAMDIAAAMAYVHSRNIIHRDLKSKNLLVDESWRVKVCDFGLARTTANRPMTLCGTDDWMAPEVILGMQYNQKADVFSFGIVLCEIITRKKISLELQRSPMDAFGMDVGKFKQLIPEDCPLDFAVLALECCAYDAEDRPSFKDIIAKLKIIYEAIPDEEQARPNGGSNPPPQSATSTTTAKNNNSSPQQTAPAPASNNTAARNNNSSPQQTATNSNAPKPTVSNQQPSRPAPTLASNSVQQPKQTATGGTGNKPASGASSPSTQQNKPPVSAASKPATGSPTSSPSAGRGGAFGVNLRSVGGSNPLWKK